MRRILILKPRLDMPFKKFGLEISNPNLPPIRVWWSKFVDTLKAHHERMGDKVVLIEAQRWMFDVSLVDRYSPDVAYIPHVEKHNFEGGDNCMYYMQTVVPWMFTIDHQGWAGGGSFVGEDFDTDQYADRDIFNQFKERMKRGESKFEQPNDNTFNCAEPFIFCPLQIPHDETIKWHSRVKCDELVESLCAWSDKYDKAVVFKGHPVNPGSMEPLKKIASGRKKVIWVDNANIHHIMSQENLEAVYVINSGTGIEAMTHEVPVVRFGNAEYNDAVIRGRVTDLHETYNKIQKIDKKIMVDLYAKFYSWYFGKICYNASDIGTFMKLK